MWGVGCSMGIGDYGMVMIAVVAVVLGDVMGCSMGTYGESSSVVPMACR